MHGLIELFNVNDCLFDLDRRPTLSTLGNSFELKVPFTRLSCCSFFLSNRAGSCGNKLSDDCVRFMTVFLTLVLSFPAVVCLVIHLLFHSLK